MARGTRTQLARLRARLRRRHRRRAYRVTRIVGHSDGFPGINSKLDIFLDTGYTVAVMSNYDMGAMPVAEKIRELLERLQ